jgi:hypothetical protein
MGACQSSQSAIVENGHVKNKSIDLQGTGRTLQSDSDVYSHIAPHKAYGIQNKKSDVKFRQEAVKDGTAASKSEQYKNRPGYSSGGSSSLGDSYDEEILQLPGRGGSRHDKLCEWKQELASTGDLTSKIVRIEVRLPLMMLCFCFVLFCSGGSFTMFLFCFFGFLVCVWTCRRILDEPLKIYTKEYMMVTCLGKEWRG